MSNPSPTNPSLTALAQVSVPIFDLDRAVTFYRDVLGLTLLFRAEPGMAFFTVGGVRLMLTRGETPDQQPPGSILYFATADIDASWQAVLAGGAVAVGAPHRVAALGASELWLAFFRDSEGNLLALSEERPVAG